MCVCNYVYMCLGLPKQTLVILLKSTFYFLPRQAQPSSRVVSDMIKYARTNKGEFDVLARMKSTGNCMLFCLELGTASHSPTGKS